MGARPDAASSKASEVDWRDLATRLTLFAALPLLFVIAAFAHMRHRVEQTVALTNPETTGDGLA
jgi:hypothetical protein